MDPRLLDLPLAVKIPVPPRSKPVFTRAKLGEKLYRPSCYFDLGDPYSRQMSTEYNSLHDPHLREYHNRKRNLRRLKREGYVTSDGKVVCTVKEFNDYRQYLTRLKQETEKTFRREEERLRQRLAKLEDATELLGPIDTSRLAEWLLHPENPPRPPAPESRKTALKSGRCRGVKAALGTDQTYSQPELPSSDADSKGKADIATHSVFKAGFEQDSGCQYSEILELPRGNVSRRQPQPSQTSLSRQGVEKGQGFSRASGQRGLVARKGAKLPVLELLPHATAAAVLRGRHTVRRESIPKAVPRAEQRHADGAPAEDAHRFPGSPSLRRIRRPPSRQEHGAQSLSEESPSSRGPRTLVGRLVDHVLGSCAAREV